LNVHSTRQALAWIGLRIKPTAVKQTGNKPTPVENALECLAAIPLCHIPVEHGDFRPKAIYAATMTRRVLMAMVDPEEVDDRDYVGNKRLEL
jgi:DNA-directed RNA polymerase III subunit RPC2